MIEIPLCYIKDKDIDYEKEIFSIFGFGIIDGNFHFPPPSIGVWSLWEILDSPIIKGELDYNLLDLQRLIFINCKRKAAVPLLYDWVQKGKPRYENGKNRNKFDVEVIKYCNKFIHNILDSSVLNRIFKEIMTCHNGYEMFNGGKGKKRLWLFAGEALGAVCLDNIIENEKIFWEVPVVLLGHYCAAASVREGEKNVSRPKDQLSADEQIKLAKEREEKGELHEWQIRDPIAFDLSPVQKTFPELVIKYAELHRSAMNKLKGIKPEEGESNVSKN